MLNLIICGGLLFIRPLSVLCDILRRKDMFTMHATDSALFPWALYCVMSMFVIQPRQWHSIVTNVLFPRLNYIRTRLHRWLSTSCDRLQSSQYAAVRPTTGARWFDHVTHLTCVTTTGYRSVAQRRAFRLRGSVRSWTRPQHTTVVFIYLISPGLCLISFPIHSRSTQNPIVTGRTSQDAQRHVTVSGLICWCYWKKIKNN